MSSAEGIVVHDNPDKHRFDVTVDGTLAGFAVYRSEPGRIVFVHTEVSDEWAGRGVGTALAREALDDVRRRGLHMTPQCPFIAAYVRDHPEYVDLVDEAHRSAFEVGRHA